MNASATIEPSLLIASARSLLPDDPAAAESLIRQVLEHTPQSDVAMRLLGLTLRAQGRFAESAAAHARAIDLSARQPDMVAAIRYFLEGRVDAAERVVRARLAAHPDDVAALCLHADIADRMGIYAEAERLLREVLVIAPDFIDAKIRLANALLQRGGPHEALELLNELLDSIPNHGGAARTRIRILGQIGEYEAAVVACEAVLARHPNDVSLLVSYGNVLKTVGRSAQAIAAYRKAIATAPGVGLGWWSLSNMKAGQLDARDISAMRALLGEPDTNDQNRLYLHFALGKALEDAADFAESMKHYQLGNALRLRAAPYDRRMISDEVSRSIELFSNAFLRRRSTWGATDRAPIFILGMPRAGSTLIEQILSSHPAIEGTSELPDIPLLVHRLIADRWRDPDSAYPGIMNHLEAEDVAGLGRDYIQAAFPHRKTDRPFFIDKLPNNWIYVAFIRLILPNAKIIDARRDAMSCCFSNFKQHFAHGQDFAYSLGDVSSYYRDYVRLMTHFDDVMPGVVYRVQHERLLADPEAEIRNLLGYLELPFDQSCLEFHANDRPVRTASSEQVRRPINNDAIDQWRNFEPWLDELKAALGPLAAD